MKQQEKTEYEIQNRIKEQNFSFKQFYRENQVYPQRTVHKDLSFFVIQSFKFQVRLCF